MKQKRGITPVIALLFMIVIIAIVVFIVVSWLSSTIGEKETCSVKLKIESLCYEDSNLRFAATSNKLLYGFKVLLNSESCTYIIDQELSADSRQEFIMDYEVECGTPKKLEITPIAFEDSKEVNCDNKKASYFTIDPCQNETIP